MKIIHLGKFDEPDTGGIENHVNNLCKGLASKKINVINIISNRAFKFKRIFKFNYEIISLPAFFRFFSTAINIFLPIYVLKKVFYDRYNFIHIHHPDPLSHFTVLFLPKRIKIILTWHCDIHAYKFLYFFYKPLLKNLLKRVDHIIVATPKHISSSDILNNIEYKHKISIIPYSIDVKYFNNKIFHKPAKLIKDRFKNKIIIFTLSRHVYYKGIRFLIDAMKEINNAMLLIGGNGPDTNKLKNYIAEKNLNEKIIFTGYISQNKLPSYYHAADIFCLPSIEKSEAFGIAMAEAMACSKPIIVTKLNNGVNYVCTEENGITVRGGSVLEIVNAIKKLQCSKELRLQYGLKGKKRILDLFNQDIMINKTISLYNKIQKD